VYYENKGCSVLWNTPGKEPLVIRSVLKACDIMGTFSSAEPRLTLAQISKRLGLPKSTAFNLLNTLLSCSFIEKTDDGRYALGTAAIALSQAVRVNVEFRDRAAPLLRDLADASGESVYLVVLDGDHGLYIYAVESPRRLLARTAVGDRVHLHCTSVGKAILAGLSTAEVDGIVARAGLPAFTETTITERNALHEELEKIRTRGYALDCAEHEPATYCVGAPIRNHSGEVIGACSVSGADPEVSGGRSGELARLVMYTAQEVSRRMGYVPDKVSMVVEPAHPVTGNAAKG
jgi:DNA-binding IclR family transcriptional regulator